MIGSLMDKTFTIEGAKLPVHVAVVLWINGPSRGWSYEYYHRLDVLSPEEEAMFCLARLGTD